LAGDTYKLLVGYNTLGATAPVSDYVIAPLVPITIPARQLPGFATTDPTPTTIGRYAYWVGDEGLKAKVNISIPESLATAQPGSAENLTLFKTAQRTGIEAVSNFSGLNAPGSYRSSGPTSQSETFRSNLNTLTQSSQIPFLTGASVTQTTNQARFHDITVHGYGVLADQRAGGLRKDLSRGLEASSASLSGSILSSPAASLPAAPDEFIPYTWVSGNTTVISLNDVPSKTPDWALLKSYYNYRTIPAVPRAQTNTTHGIYPLLTTFKAGIGCADNGSGLLRVQLRPVVVLTNPYNVPLAPADYLIRWTFPASWAGRNFTIKLESGGTPVVSATYGALNMSDGNGSIHGSRFFNDSSGSVQLKISGAAFAPGEVRRFCLTADTEYVNGGSGANSVTLSPSGGPARALYKDTTQTLTGFDFVTMSSSDFSPGYIEGYTNLALFLNPGPTRTLLQNAEVVHFFQEKRKKRLNEADPVATLYAALKTPRTLTYNYQKNIGGGGNDNRMGLRAFVDINPRYKFTYDQSKLGMTQWLFNPNWHVNDSILPPPLDVPTWSGSSPNSTVSGTNGAWGLDNTTEAFVSLFEIPRRDLFSLAQLQHVQFLAWGMVPAYAFGNSYASPWVASGKSDLSYALNMALWDRYFFSTIPGINSAPTPPVTADNLMDSSYNLPNSRLKIYRRDSATSASLFNDAFTNGFDRASANLLINGAFNINSTSIEAWKAQLASLNGLSFQFTDIQSNITNTLNPPTSPPSSSDLTTFTNPILRSVYPGGDNKAPWRGFRTLSEDQLESLASRIVAQIKAYGPFVSLSQFVNRKLTDSYAGPLQRAIDNPPVNPAAPTAAETTFATSAIRINPQPNPSNSSLSLLPIDTVSGTSAALPATGAAPNINATNYRYRATNAPGWLSQADLLTALGPVIAARSDTFLIRTYGETVNPLDPTQITARAWCEAIVQRLPDYIDTTGNTADAPPVDPASGAVILTSANQIFGRSYKVVSFRWITANDI
jgi:hypothetical protein